MCLIRRILPAQSLLRQHIADELHELHQHDNDRNHSPGDLVLEPLVAVNDSDLTQAVVAVIIVLVQLVQLIGNMLAKKALRR